MTQPFKCPVCEGRTHVPAGFYGGDSTATNDEQCRSCLGQGIVWSQEPVQVQVQADWSGAIYGGDNDGTWTLVGSELVKQ